ncbi:helix-turn-helix domain-containing protein [Longispora sp. K20-0274]|uniref:ArsR/SmtB family transcription factor n=1 Tax=Longispora sp. K20-0274 TaxID=3088255 RepID=UPI00399A7392
MSQVRFEVGDLAEIRFCVSPIWETVTSLWALADPGRHVTHLPWIKWARSVAARRDVAPHLELLTAFARPKAWLPDFLTPSPAGPLETIDDDLARLRATPLDIVTADVLVTDGNKVPLRPLGRLTAERPGEMLPRIADAVHVWWRAAILPHWPRMRALLEADISYRARLLADGGAKLLFDTLHPATSWAGDRLVIADGHDIDIAVNGAGFPLAPSLFYSNPPALTVSAWSAPSAFYQVRSLGTLWETRAGTPAAVARLLGPSRAQVLAMVSSPATTTSLADRTGLTPGTVSQHLGVLRDAGLVTGYRQGREVIYTCTDLGTALLGDS